MNQIANSTNLLRESKKQAFNLSNSIKDLEHTDMSIQTYINKVKKLSFQSLDLLQEMERQFGFLANTIKNYELRENLKKRNLQKRKELESRRQRRRDELFA